MNDKKVDVAQLVAPPPQDVSGSALPNNTVKTDGLGSLLYHVHSTHIKNILCATETTSLQFYEHVVIATISSSWACLPKKYSIHVIPRFKIVDAGFSLGPRSIPKIVYFILAASLTLIIIGASLGGCKKCSDGGGSSSSSYYSYYSSYSYNSDCDNGGACASLVIGCLLLVIPVPILLLLPVIWKWHYIYLDVKTPSNKIFNFGGIASHAFRFKKMGFDTNVGNAASFDEFYLIEYVFGSLGKAGNTVTDEAHLLSHFNHASLSMPIVPIHADSTIKNLMTDGIKNRKSNIGGVGYAEV